ncbi:EAL domain-containing protein [Massilia sp. CF038]|uniref:bifunctional diguanylate cyclase/phosphodiesterase n=1 Tax=Massilia sp. CF038 TaxID=1881045 RepID=UPI000922B436|nr:EAL domain-containing protein [Massilia sp. CF038]SHH06647.1 diguanylate cyclase/phosphodiesterase [Massilia sp. CF038]
MSMYRQLWIALIIGTLLALTGGLLATTLSARSYLQTQLEMKNVDNANVLAQSLGQRGAEPVELELAIAALFDSGHYDVITLTDPSGKVLVERRAPAVDSGVPAWFTSLLPLHAAPGSAHIASGWKQVGTVTIVSRSHFAYQALWNSTLQMIAALALSGLVAGYLATLILRRLKRPLDAVVEQARAIADRRFVTTPESNVPELRQLTSAMNSASVLLKSMFAEEADRLEAIRREANTDALTGLANRHHFMEQMRETLNVEDGAQGSLILLRLSQLADLNRQLGHKATDTMLAAIGSLFEAQAQQHGGFAARLNGSDFALVLRGAEPHAVAQLLLDGVSAQASERSGQEARVFVGMGKIQFGLNLGALLSQVDTALATAEAQGVSAVREELPLNIAEAPRSGDEWAKLIMRSLEQRWVKLASFPVLDLEGRVVHRESALRLMFGGEWFPAARFLPIAERIGLTTRLDLVAVTLGLEELAKDAALPGLAVNLSARSIQDKEFRHQLLDLIAARPAAASRLWLEVPESGVFAQLDAFRVFCDAVRWSGCKLGIEHFGRHFKQIGLVHDMALNYVKVDGSFVRDLNSNSGNQIFLKGLNSIAHKMGMQVFAEGVGDVDELNALSGLGFDGATGPGVQEKAAPAAIDT